MQIESIGNVCPIFWRACKMLYQFKRSLDSPKKWQLKKSFPGEVNLDSMRLFTSSESGSIKALLAHKVDLLILWPFALKNYQSSGNFWELLLHWGYCFLAWELGCKKIGSRALSALSDFGTEHRERPTETIIISAHTTRISCEVALATCDP